MPAKFVEKNYCPNQYYHVYNRGAHKAPIFLEPEDYWVFREKLRQALRVRVTQVSLTTFSLIPNHFHFQLFQIETRGVTSLMQSFATQYYLYFNKKYEHSGALCQGTFKAVPLLTFKKIRENQTYILDNPREAGLVNWEHVGWTP